MKILVINAGSSSIKYKLYTFSPQRFIFGGNTEKIGEKGSGIRDHHQAVEEIFTSLKRNCVIESLSEIHAVGHRVVHGGEKFKEPVVITEKVIKNIRESVKLAPLHNPANLEGIYACRKLLKGVPQVAVFDTAFHQTIPEYACIYPIPMWCYSRYGIRRYGFHGVSHQYVAYKASKPLRKSVKKLRLITCHLGNGCNITAIKNGVSVDTSMGFTPLEGVMMGTRSGSIDPAIIGFLMREKGMDISEVDTLLNKKSGLLGVSGLSNDIRIIKNNIKKSRMARLALEMFIYRIKKQIGAYFYILGGPDAIVFTAGIGEHNCDIVKEITREIRMFSRKKVRILTIPTDEEEMIGFLTYRILKKRLRNK